MPYLNVDDNFPEHSKIDALSDGAFRLQVAGMAYCARKLTDGRIEKHRVHRLMPVFKPAYLKELIGGTIWHDLGQGCDTDTCPAGQTGFYVVHDYLEWNKPREWWEERRKAETERIAEWRRKKRQERAS